MLSTLEISCQRGRHLLWSDISLSLDAGQLLFVRGANGRGKSSLLRILAGLSSPDSGEVLWHGKKITQVASLYHSELLFIGHQTPLKPELTALENLIFLTQLHGQGVQKNQVKDALHTWGLEGKSIELPTKHLSQGQKQRVTLTQLTLLKKNLWILDEPFNSLDANGSKLLSLQLEQHLANNHCAVLTSHLHETIAHIAPSLQDREIRIEF
jgi:heme exporter protein A